MLVIYHVAMPLKIKVGDRAILCCPFYDATILSWYFYMFRFKFELF